ncbi:hypothetical protein F4801DRAFT_576630 [Xylaria longipes]|nr:hypothetical protein F4801DRAFT_576630 [Xylaria longipes]
MNRDSSENISLLVFNLRHVQNARNCAKGLEIASPPNPAPRVGITMDEYPNREFNRDANLSPWSSIVIPKDLVPEPNSPAPIFGASGSPFINHGSLASDKSPINPLEKPTMAAKLPAPSRFVKHHRIIKKPPLVATSVAQVPPSLFPLRDASSVKSVTPPPRLDKEIAEDDFGRLCRLGHMGYESESYPPSPKLYPLIPDTAAVAAASEANPEGQPKLPEVSSTPSEQQAQQDQRFPQTSGQLPVHSLHPQASVPAAAATTMDQATQTQTQTQTPYPTTATAEAPAPTPVPTPVPSEPLPPQQPASSAPSETNPATSRAPSTVPPPSQQATGPPATPSQPPPYQPSRVWLNAPSAMAQPIFCTPPPYWYCYPGATPGQGYSSTWNQQSPYYSGTAHHFTNPPIQVPQVYTVEPAYIMPQQAMYTQAAAYYQAAPQAAGAYYYYAPGAPTYYRT